MKKMRIGAAMLCLLLMGSAQAGTDSTQVTGAPNPTIVRVETPRAPVRALWIVRDALTSPAS
ncbi:MAG TPA: hypothetical protein VFP10_10725, partial [Candidatus Eisenbacteria bacterium]|nr:hypothetical protein [Candidatus Eisenbacteria bacterium]